MASGLEFGIDQFAPYLDLKCSPAAGDQRPRFDLWLKLFDQVCRDTHDFWCIVSSRAVFDRDFLFCHGLAPFLFVRSFVRLGSVFDTSIPQHVALLKWNLSSGCASVLGRISCHGPAPDDPIGERASEGCVRSPNPTNTELVQITAFIDAPIFYTSKAVAFQGVWGGR